MPVADPRADEPGRPGSRRPARPDDGSRAVSALVERDGPRPNQLEKRALGTLPSIVEIAKADDDSLDSLVIDPPPILPAPRGEWLARDVAVPDGGDLVIRLLGRNDATSGDWLEAVHVPTRTVRRLPARAQDESETEQAEAGSLLSVSWCFLKCLFDAS